MSLVDVLKSLIQLHYLFQLPWRSMMIIRIYFSFFSYNRCNPSLTLIHSTVHSTQQRSTLLYIWEQEELIPDDDSRFMFSFPKCSQRNIKHGNGASHKARPPLYLR